MVVKLNNILFDDCRQLDGAWESLWNSLEISSKEIQEGVFNAITDF